MVCCPIFLSSSDLVLLDKCTDEKNRITNGLWSNWASMAVRTGSPGPSGLSMLVVPLLDTPGVTMRRLKVGGQSSAGTTFIELDDVKVPVENLIGVEGQGMKYVMQNFNHERLTISISVNRLARVALSSAFEYCLKREAFGKTLMDQPVVRHRLAKCGADLEAHWAWVEQFTYCMTKLSEADANRELGGLTALAKAQAGRVIETCASTAILLFGGNGYTKSGQGAIVESTSSSSHSKAFLSLTQYTEVFREIPGARIPGSSEDVMLDLAVRQLVKNFKAKTKELEKSGGSKL
jgi:acyl-CoA dehydrogenase